MALCEMPRVRLYTGFAGEAQMLALVGKVAYGAGWRLGAAGVVTTPRDKAVVFRLPRRAREWRTEVAHGRGLRKSSTYMALVESIVHHMCQSGVAAVLEFE